MLASTRSCSLLVLTVFAVLSLQAGLRHGPLIPHPRIMPLKLKSIQLVKRTSVLGCESDARLGADTGVRITGYWKEVRSSLGLPLLSDVILVSSGMDQQFNAGDRVDEGGGTRLQRLGRLVPRLRRREEATFTSASNSSIVESQPPADEDENQPRLKRTERDIPLQATRLQHNYTSSPSVRLKDLANSESSEDSVDDELQANAYSNSYSPNSSPRPDLFISSDAHNRPRTPVSALAASFRAIAARELKTRHASRAHISGTRPGSTRRGNRSRR